MTELLQGRPTNVDFRAQNIDNPEHMTIIGFGTSPLAETIRLGIRIERHMHEIMGCATYRDKISYVFN